MARRFLTLTKIARYGRELRVTCTSCEHAREVDPQPIVAVFERNGWAVDLPSAAKHFRCGECGSTEHVQLAVVKLDGRSTSSAGVIEAIYHGMRAGGKRVKRGW